MVNNLDLQTKYKTVIEKRKGVSSVVGNVLLVAIVFLMGSIFAGLVLTSDFEPTPDATVDVEQTNTCEVGEKECKVKIEVQQMDNANYVFPKYIITSGSSIPEIDKTLVVNQVPEDAPEEPENTGSLTEDTAKVTVGGDEKPLASLLYGAGDVQTAEKVEVGTQIIIYAGIDGNERVIQQYTVRENSNTFG